MLGRGALPLRRTATAFVLVPALVLVLVVGGCSGDDDGVDDGTAVTEAEDTLAPPATVDTPALPVGTDTPGTEVAADDVGVTEIPVALAVALRSYGDEWTSLSFVRGGDDEWPDLVADGVDRAAASGSAAIAVDGVVVTVFAAAADSDIVTAALVEDGATAIEVGGTTLYEPPASRRTPLGSALAGLDVVGSAHGLLVVAAGDDDTTIEQIAALASRPLAAWEASAVLSATVLGPLFGSDRIVAAAGALDPLDAYRVAHPGASAATARAWVDDAALLPPPASPIMTAAGSSGADPASADGRAVALYRTPEDATAAAEWIVELWASAASYDGTTTWADAFGEPDVSTDGTVLTIDVAAPGEAWLAAPLPLAWSAPAAADATGGTVSPAD